MPIADKMDIQRCLEILELDHTPSSAEIRQAYKDLVNVWHPDRFVHNPRLREKAEKKLKDINRAYQLLISQSQWDMNSEQSELHHSGTEKSEYHGNTKAAPNHSSHLPKTGKTELAVEFGTRAVLTVCYSLYKVFNHVVAELEAKAEREATAEGQKPNKR